MLLITHLQLLVLRFAVLQLAHELFALSLQCVSCLFELLQFSRLALKLRLDLGLKLPSTGDDVAGPLLRGFGEVVGVLSGDCLSATSLQEVIHVSVLQLLIRLVLVEHDGVVADLHDRAWLQPGQDALQVLAWLRTTLQAGFVRPTIM